MDKENIKIISFKAEDKVEIVGTGKVAAMPKGVTHKVHAELAQKLVKAGKATLKK